MDRSNWVAIIGSREASSKELETAYTYAKQMVTEGKIVVSGLAIGIDAFAHQGAIDAGGKTIAIVNTPVTQAIYPEENMGLAEEIRKNGFILYPYGTRANKKGKEEKGISHFTKRLIERDVLLARLCPTIVAVKDEDRPITGGTRYGVHYGKKFNQEVCYGQ